MPTQVTVPDIPAKTGGQGHIYFTPDGRYAVKVFKDARLDKTSSLQRVMELLRNVSHEKQRFIAPPLALVATFDGAPKVGFLMRRVDPRYRELSGLILSPMKAGAQFKAGKTWAQYLKVARSVARAVTELHGRGCAHSDLHPGNFLADLDSGDAVMLEMDGVVAPGVLPPDVDGIPEFVAPEILRGEATPSRQTDAHSLAVLLLRTLLFRNVLEPLTIYDGTDDRNHLRLAFGRHATFSEDPADRRNRPRTLRTPLFYGGSLSYQILDPQLQALSRQAFLQGLHAPSLRPLPSDWHDALASAFDGLWRCQRLGCGQFFPYPFWVASAKRRCPFCGTLCPSPGPVVLELHDQSRRDRYTSHRRHVVLGTGFKLFEDVVSRHRVPPVTRAGHRSVGRLEWDDRRREYRLLNEDDRPWVARSLEGRAATTAKPGESLPATTDAVLYFGDGRRAARVKEAGEAQPGQPNAVGR